MWRVIASSIVVLCLLGCESDTGSTRFTTPVPPETLPVEAPPVSPPAPALQAEFPQPPFNTVTSASPKYEATQILSTQPPQTITSRRYAMTVSMF